MGSLERVGRPGRTTAYRTRADDREQDREPERLRVPGDRGRAWRSPRRSSGRNACLNAAPMPESFAAGASRSSVSGAAVVAAASSSMADLVRESVLGSIAATGFGAGGPLGAGHGLSCSGGWGRVAAIVVDKPQLRAFWYQSRCAATRPSPPGGHACIASDARGPPRSLSPSPCSRWRARGRSAVRARAGRGGLGRLADLDPRGRGGADGRGECLGRVRGDRQPGARCRWT